MTDDHREWALAGFRGELEQISCDFQSRDVEALRHPVPQDVWHYTSAAAAEGILSSRKLWLTSTLSAADRQEVHWGNALVCAAALRLDEELGGSAAIDALLNDHKASLFLNEPEVFIGCFTSCGDVVHHWQARSEQGIGLVFDSKELSCSARVSPIGATGLLRVQYDHRVILKLAESYYRRVLATCEEVSNLTAEDQRPLAQWLMETGFLAFITKRASWSWEEEFRIVGRSVLHSNAVYAEPRRMEIDLEATSLRRVVLGPKTPRELQLHLVDLVRQHWSQDVSVEVSKASKLSND